MRALSDPDDPRARITEDWLKSVGFKWHQLDRQPSKQWLLWLLTEDASIEELGIELAPVGRDDSWFCWLRADVAGRYSRFLHVRCLRYQEEVIRLVAALTGRPWRPEDHFYGLALPPERAAREREERERLDRRFQRAMPWNDVERDDSIGGALPDHLVAHERDRGRCR